MFFRSQNKFEMINAASALPGRGLALRTANNHFLSGRPLKSEVPDGFHEAMFGMGCFWGVERMFWKLDGVWISMVGYAGVTHRTLHMRRCVREKQDTMKLYD